MNRPTDHVIGDDSRAIKVELEVERANVSKQTYVTEEVNIDKVAQTRTETFNETVRREELDVQENGVERVDGVNPTTLNDVNRKL